MATSAANAAILQALWARLKPGSQRYYRKNRTPRTEYPGAIISDPAILAELGPALCAVFPPGGARRGLHLINSRLRNANGLLRDRRGRGQRRLCDRRIRHRILGHLIGKQ